MYSCHLFLISSASVRSIPLLSFIESSLHEMFPWYLYFLALIAEEGFLISSCYSLELCIHMFLLHGNGGNSVRCDYQRVRILAGGNRILLPRKEATIFYQNIIDTKGIFVLCVSCSVVSNSLRPYGPKPTLKIQS